MEQLKEAIDCAKYKTSILAIGGQEDELKEEKTAAATSGSENSRAEQKTQQSDEEQKNAKYHTYSILLGKCPL